MKVSELIEWLQTQDQEATVEVVDVDTKWHRPVAGAVELDVDILTEYTDFRKNRFVDAASVLRNKRTLLLGRID